MPIRRPLRRIFASMRPKLFRPDGRRDTFLVSYPRSGNTWIRNIIACIQYGRSPQSFIELGQLVPDIHRLPVADDVPLRDNYVVKSHHHFSIQQNDISHYNRVIYVLRHPLDVLLSYHRFSGYVEGYSGSLKEFAQDWVAGRIGFGRWDVHVDSWLEPVGMDRSLSLEVFRYEQLLSSPIEEVTRLADYLGLPVSEERAKEISEESSPTQMRAREIAGVRNGLKIEGFQFVGKATSGQWEDVLRGDILSMLRREIGEKATKYGYEF